MASREQEIINSKQFVREPVDSICKDINESSSKRIILNGGRGTGKSIILQNMENRGVGTDAPTIYTRFDSVINFSMNPDKFYSEEFFRHYYEIDFSWKLLNHIKKYYGLIYEKHFKDIELLLDSLSNELDQYINNAFYKKMKINMYLNSMDIVSEILNRLKKYLSLSEINIAIDRFDWTNGRSSFVQQNLSNYFDAFDKTIITTDDEALDNDENQKDLKEKGYSFVAANYGLNTEVVKAIIKRRIQKYNSKSDSSLDLFNVDAITDEICQNLINKTDGNISSMVVAAFEVLDLLRWYGEKESLPQLFEAAADSQVKKVRTLKKMSIEPKLYL